MLSGAAKKPKSRRLICRRGKTRATVPCIGYQSRNQPKWVRAAGVEGGGGCISPPPPVSLTCSAFETEVVAGGTAGVPVITHA